MTKTDTKGKLYHPEIWRVEFSMHSDADGWIVYEMQNRKKVRKQAIPHKLDMFDSPDKVWARFQNLAYHYFHFKHVDYIGGKRGLSDIALSMVNSEYKLHHPLEDIRKACDILLKSIDGLEKLRFIPLGDETERLAMQLALSRKIEGDKRYFFEIIAEIKALLANDKLL